MAQKDDLQLASQNWQKRIDWANQNGLPASSYQTLMDRDYSQIVQLGSSPMDDKTARDAMLATVHASPIKAPAPISHDFWGTLGNIPSDLQNYMSSIPAGLYNFATTLPQKVADLKDIAEQDPETIKQYGLETSPGQPLGHTDDLAGALRNAAKLPLLGLIPGLQTAASFTTDTGRKQLEEHPVSTLLDIGAAVSGVGSEGVFGTGVFGPAEYDKAYKAALDSGATKAEAFQAANEVSPLTSLEALRRGQPYKALGRALIGPGQDVLTGELPTGLRAPLRVKGARLAENIGVGTKAARINRALNETQQLLRARMSEYQNSPIIHDLTKGLSQEDRDLLGRVANRVEKPGDFAAFNAKPELGALLERARAESARLAEENPNLLDIKTPWGATYKYNKNSQVGRAKTQLEAHIAAVAGLAQRHQDALAQFDDYAKRFGLADQRTSDAGVLAMQLRDRLKTATSNRIKAEARLQTRIVANAPANFFPMLAKRLRQRGIQLASEPGRFTAEELPDVIKHLTNSSTWPEFEKALGDVTLANRTRQEIESTWSDIAQADIHANRPEPIFLPNVPEAQVHRTPYPTVRADVQPIKPNVSKASEFNLSKSVYDVAVGLTDNQRQLLEAWGTNHFVNEVLRPDHIDDPTGVVRTATSVKREITDAEANGRTGGVDVRSQADAEIARNYKPWDRDNHLQGLAQYFPSVGKDEVLLLPRYVDRSLGMLGFNREYGPLHAAFDKATGLWRFTILSTPRHISHVILGGLMMGMLREPGAAIETATHLRQALDLLRGKADPELKAMLGRNLNEFDAHQIVLYSGGKTIGRWMNQILRPFDWVNKVEENVTMMYKVMTMQHLESKVGRDEAMRIANKVFVDVNAMTPLERVIFKKVFPFYGFTRHVMRYALTYPADYPLRASILANFAEQQQKDWDSGLPQALQWLFYLGPPDANGMVNAIDYRSIDPFRSFYNNFTIAGITSQMNPLFQMFANQAGLNTLSATPELYPGRHVDPVSGNFVADRPKGVALSLL